MKKIYIIMTQLPTFTNKSVYFITGFKYTHFSISLDDKFEKLYAFQVKNKSHPLIGGFVTENESFYFHGKKNIKLNEIVFEIPVKNKEYNNISEYISTIKNDSEYIFNYVSSLFMFIVGGIKVYKSYHCAEFVSEVLSMIDNIKLPKKTYKMHPKDVYNVLKKFKHYEKVIYSDDYEIDYSDSFFKEIKFTKGLAKSYYIVSESIIRSITRKPRKKYNYKKTIFTEKDYKN